MSFSLTHLSLVLQLTVLSSISPFSPTSHLSNSNSPIQLQLTVCPTSLLHLTVLSSNSPLQLQLTGDQYCLSSPSSSRPKPRTMPSLATDAWLSRISTSDSIKAAFAPSSFSAFRSAAFPSCFSTSSGLALAGRSRGRSSRSFSGRACFPGAAMFLVGRLNSLRRFCCSQLRVWQMNALRRFAVGSSVSNNRMPCGGLLLAARSLTAKCPAAPLLLLLLSVMSARPNLQLCVLNTSYSRHRRTAQMRQSGVSFVSAE